MKGKEVCFLMTNFFLLRQALRGLRCLRVGHESSSFRAYGPCKSSTFRKDRNLHKINNESDGQLLALLNTRYKSIRLLIISNRFVCSVPLCFRLSEASKLLA